MDERIEPRDYYSCYFSYSVRRSSSTGQTLIYASGYTKKAEEIAKGSEHHVFLYTDDGNLRQLTRTGKTRHPRWRPNSSSVAVISARTDDYWSQVDRSSHDSEKSGHSIEVAGHPQIWLYDLMAGGDPVRITNHSGPVHSFDWSPDGDKIVFEATAPPTDIDDDSDSSPGRELTVREFAGGNKTTDESTPTRQLYVLDPEREQITKLDSTWSRSNYHQPWYRTMKPAWGPDDRIAFVANQSDEPDVFDVFSIGADGTDCRRHTPSDATYSDPRWSPDGNRIAFVRNYGEQQYIPSEACYTTVDTTDTAHSLSTYLDRDVHFIDWLDDETLVGPVSDEGAGVLYQFAPDDTPSVFFAPEKPTSIKWSGLFKPFQIVREDQLILTPVLHPSYDGVAELSYGTADSPSPRSMAVFHRFNEHISEKSGTKVKYTNFDNSEGEIISGLLYTPADYDPDSERKYPLLLDIHRTAHAVNAPRFHFRHHYWTDRGYVVLKVNFRGSRSFGRSFGEAITDGYVRKATDDIESAVRTTLSEERIDERNVFAVGFAYGATCVVQLLAESDLFTAAVAQHGVFDFADAYGTEKTKQRLEDVLGKPWENPRAYRRESPIHDAAKIEDPLLLITGEDDTPCVRLQSKKIYIYLDELGTDVKLLEYSELGSSAYLPPHVTVDKLDAIESWIQKNEDSS